jgi:NAD(P)-dependent dehydrogenase (short-subunit alcohol dehydrogenase family)
MATNQPRVWLITGASSGFGRAIAEAALAVGDIVIAAARRTGALAYSATKFALEGWSEALAKEVERFGIRVLIVEPGAFRTSFNGPGALLLSKRIPAYDEQIDPLRTGMAEDDGRQPGDPAKAAAAILLALDSPDPPLRLALGNDAVDAIAESLEGAKAELAAWERVGRSAVFD